MQGLALAGLGSVVLQLRSAQRDIVAMREDVAEMIEVHKKPRRTGPPIVPADSPIHRKLA